MSKYKPILITSSESRLLKQLNISNSGFTEKELQTLCYENPHILPVNEIEPIYSELVPVCMELQVPAGFCDIIYINSNGLLTLVETKLWRNPEARRKVISQILDYAKDLTGMTYAEFERRCLAARKGNEKSLYKIVTIEDDSIEEAYFIDQVTKNLNKGRFLLLIVGDGIRENAQEIADYINRYANLSFTLAMVESPIYLLDNNSKIVIPRVTVKTTLIEREVYITKDKKMEFVEEAKTPRIAKTATESEFYSRLGKNIGTKNAIEVKRLVDSLVDELDMTVSMGTGKKITLSLKDPSGIYNFGYICEDGVVKFFAIVDKTEKIGHGYISENYLSGLADLLGSEYDKSTAKRDWGIRKDGVRPNITKYLQVSQEWKKLLAKALSELAEAEY
jgi:hypothetical protein